MFCYFITSLTLLFGACGFFFFFFTKNYSLSLFPSLSFSFFFFFQVPIYLNSFPLFLLSPSLISKPQPLYAAGAQLCVCDCACTYARIRVCLCGFFLAQHCHCEHSSLYTKNSSNNRRRIGGKVFKHKKLRC